MSVPGRYVPDRRDIAGGHEIPSEGYCDQPYVVHTDDGGWLCTLTTGGGREGDRGQHVVACRSQDCGRTWSELVDIEPAGGPEASWVMPVRVPTGCRVYAFYVYNADGLQEVTSDHGPIRRVDTLGEYAFRYSDDGGRSWSAQRYHIPVRATAIDRANPYGGRVRFFWGVGKPVVVPWRAAPWAARPAGAADAGGPVIFGFAKVGRFGDGFMATSEGWFLRCDNLCDEADPERLVWQLLPDGDDGLRAPAGPVADEHNPTWLDDGSLYCTYRTVDGHPCHAYSRDGGRSWDGPGYMAYAPHGRRIRHPRAANFVRRLANGKYLYWFHNHGGRTYQDRNPVWLCGGVERDGCIHWSQPEVVLYDRDPATRISYPDFVEEPDGRLFITETQKTVARVHEVDRSLLDGMWAQLESPGGEVSRVGLLPGDDANGVALPELATGGGFSLEAWVTGTEPGIEVGRPLVSTVAEDGCGVCLEAAAGGSVSLSLCDGRRRSVWASDRGVLDGAGPHHVVAVVDGGPGVISFVVNGQLGDGAQERAFGWGRLDRDLRDVSGSGTVRADEGVPRFRIYDRALRTAEAVAHSRVGIDA